MPDTRVTSPARLPLEVYVVPGSHFDLGWVLHGDGSLALGDHIIHEAVETLRARPQFRFLIEYVLFLRHFLESFPEHRPVVKEMLADGRMEVCATTTGLMEQILDGEALVRQYLHAIGWLQSELDYSPLCAQHTDLPGHTIQMPQILAKCGIPYFAYSRYSPPVPLHWWEGPDGSRVLACHHVQHYEWGRVLRRDLGFAERALLDYLRGPLREIWPAQQVLMPEERDLDWVEPRVCETVEQWNCKHADLARLRFATLREFFQEVDTSGCPTYRGEAPYGFYSIPAFEPQTYQRARMAENLLVAAEKFAVLRQLEGLGRIDADRLRQPWEDLFWPHDHNIAGNEGPVNDAVRTHHAIHAGVMSESMLREVETSLLVHAAADERLGRPFLVVNTLSWKRSGLAQISMELSAAAEQGVEILDADGKLMPAQLLSIERADAERIDYQLDDPDQAAVQATLAFLAKDVPATGYKTFYVRPAAGPSALASQASRKDNSSFENRHWHLQLNGGCIDSLTCRHTGRQITAPGAGGFFSIVALEDLRGNLEDGYDPWDPRDNPPNFTGREWAARIAPESLSIVEDGPARTRIRMNGDLLGCPVEQEIVLVPELPRIGLRVAIDWQGIKNRQVRLRLPFAMANPKITYETPYGSVVHGRDELPGSYRGDGTRWVQKWIDLSEPGLGITLSAGCCAVNLQAGGQQTIISPLLVSTTYCRGDAYYWTYNRGRHEFEFWLHTHTGDWQASRHYAIGWEAWNPLRVVRGQPRIVSVPHRRCLPAVREYLACDHPAVVVTVLKPAARRPGEYLVRAFNVSDRSVEASIRFHLPLTAAVTCNLVEEPSGPAAPDSNQLPISLGPHEIGSWLVCFSEHPSPCG